MIAIIFIIDDDNDLKETVVISVLMNKRRVLSRGMFAMWNFKLRFTVLARSQARSHVGV
jgi:hypothetical protein